jgi:hypothetical protein
VSTVQKVALAIVAVGAITALTLPGRQTATVLKAGGQVFNSALGTAITG